MSKLVERRKYRRFGIPGGEAKIGRLSGYALLKPFSKPYPVLNMCIGGANILCNREFDTGEDLMLEVYAPDEKAMRLRAKVIWSNSVPISNDILIGLAFSPFGDERHLNPSDAMLVLRKLYARYIED